MPRDTFGRSPFAGAYPVWAAARHIGWPIEAAAPPNDFRIQCDGGGDLTITAAEGDGPAAGPPKFTATAYTGGLMNLGWGYPVAVDLEGMSVPRQDIPALRSHDPERIVGHTTSVDLSARRIKVAGLISGVGDAADEVKATSKNEFPWQISIGATATRMEFVDQGETVKVNGQNFTGPLYVARGTTLREVSFVPLGADGATSATVAASVTGDPPMFEQWLKAKGFDAAALTPDAKAFLKAQYEAEEKAKETAKATTLAAAAAPAADPMLAFRASMSAEAARIAEVQTLAVKHPKILAAAIAEGWTAEKTNSAVLEAKLDELRKERPSVTPIPGMTEGQRETEQLSAQAAIQLSAQIKPDIVAQGLPAADKDRIMNEAMSARYRNYGISALMDDVITAAGHRHRGSRKSDDFIKAAMRAERELKAAGVFSTVSLSNVLGNTANKGLIQGYTAVETTWQAFCAVRSHGDFKTVTRVRLDSTGAFKKVGPDGELKHVGLTDTAFTNKVDTYGAIIALTRQMMINDDLGAFLELPLFLGRMSALRIEEGVWVLLLGNANSFFHANNANLLTGGASALSIAAITSLEQKFRDQVDGNTKPILTSPRVLVTGSALAVTANDIFDWQFVNETTTANAKSPNGNPHRGKYKPVVSPYANNTAIKDQDNAAITGQSATKFWLFADPAVRAALAVAFLNGNQTPTIESSDTAFETLGMQWRAYHDVGFGQEDPKAAAQSNGA